MKPSSFFGKMLCTMFVVQSITVSAQSIRFSEFYDIDNTAGVLSKLVLLEDENLFVIGGGTSGNYETGYHILVDPFGTVVQSHGYSLAGQSIKPRGAIKGIMSSSLYVSGYYCNFSVPSPSYCDFYFGKLDETGDTIFTKIYERKDTCEALLDMIQTRPNKIMLIGWTCNDTTQDNTELMFITVDTLGNEVNRVVWGINSNDYVHSGLVINEDGEVLLTGWSGPHTWLLKTDSIGNVLWNRSYPFLSPASIGDGGTRVLQLPDGNFAILGGSGNASTGDSDGYILKVNPNGDQLWTRKYIATNGSQSFWGGHALPDGGILACGQTTNTDDDSQAGWLVKTDANGDTLWTRTYNPSGLIDRLLNMLVMPNGDIVMVGSGRDTGQTNQDGWILRVDSMGCLVEGCGAVGVEEQLVIGNEQFSIWPNPTSEVLNLELQQQVMTELRVYDMAGKLMLQKQTTQQQEAIDVSALENGLYLLTVLQGEMKTTVKVMVW